MFAVIKTGGKQYKVQVGQVIDVEKLDVGEGSQVLIDQVLLAAEGSSVSYGRPVIDGAVVTADVVSQHKGPKLTVFKYKSKSRYRRRTGHRQLLTQISIQSIAVPGFETETAPAIELEAATPVDFDAVEAGIPLDGAALGEGAVAGSAAPAGDVLPVEGAQAQLGEDGGEFITSSDASAGTLTDALDPATGEAVPPQDRA